MYNLFSTNNKLELFITKRTDSKLIERMKNHYSKPKGFVGRNICYSIYYDGIYYGHIVAGSATRFLPGRNEFLGITIKQLNNVINNIFYDVSKVNNKYPCRWFTSLIIKEFVKQSIKDWEHFYGDKIIGFETLVEKPRSGNLYLHSGWTLVGETIGYTCKRIGKEKSTDSYTGKRIWDTTNLKPKLVFCYKI